MIADRRTKIVATLGPASESEDMIRQLVRAGVNVFRLNFSHGSYEEHATLIRRVRQVSLEMQAPVTILQDLQGPKIRVGKFKEGKIELKTGERVRITMDPILGEPGLIPSDFPELLESVQVGDVILLDDGLLKLKVVHLGSDHIDAEVIDGGWLKDRKGMNIPGRTLKVECLTDKDIADLEFGLRHEVDVVALSFVRFPKDLRYLRELIQTKTERSVRICAKIEMLEAIQNLEEIVRLSDIVMVARGDLAIEVGQSKLPFYQKEIIRLANRYNKPVITATQMLDSMVSHPRPTRAEITDVANAVLDGADALMLSAETATGRYPVECVKTMDEIIREVEQSSEQIYHKLSLDSEFMNDPTAIAASAAFTALKVNAKVIVCLSTTGKTARIISGFRPKARLIAATDRFEVLNELEMVWGLHSIVVSSYKTMREVKSQIEGYLLSYGLAQPGDKAVMTLGLPIDQGAKTNTLHTWTISQQEYQRLPDNNIPVRFRQNPMLS
ncbi:MAG: pyruvate kinase [Bdellovibrionaceae bacterium]|nr:pyruvate kinase [Pseudobdellovibrionaceae bacterium]MDW8191165.1 pyruvate kinase [Pseudobdellovibrionaceae bacterium]